MKTYDFDTVIDRKNTNSLKHDFAKEFGQPEDTLPLWLADMDFRVPQSVLDALTQSVEHGIFGYSDAKEGYYDALEKWFREQFGWQTKREWLVRTPGVVYALATAVRALTHPGDRVLIQPPVYAPFYDVIRNNGRVIVENKLIYSNGRYSMDFDDFHDALANRGVRLVILCSPHNPVGRVWTKEELAVIGQLCKQYDTYVVSDEIHCDFAFPEHPHTMFPVANPDLMGQSIVCTAPSKTFNIAGLQASNIWIPDETVRRCFCAEMESTGYKDLNTMAVIACRAAYEGGGEWLEQCKTYLRGNLDYVRAFLSERLPKIRLVEPDGTYFVWLDFSDLGLDKRSLNDLLSHKAKLWLDGGHIFGEDSWNFQRVVLASPRKVIEEAMERLESAMKDEGLC